MNRTERKQIRDFGIILAVAGALYAAWSLYRGHPARAAVSAGAGAALLLGGFFAPRPMRPLYRAWMLLAHVLGWLNTRLILSLIFYVLFTPLGLVMRLFGRDPLARRLEPERASYWEDADPKGDSPERMRRLF